MALGASTRHWLKTAILLLGGLGAAAGAAETFPAEVAVGEVRLSKVAEARYSILWKRITDVALYVDPEQPRPDDGILDPGYAKYITIEYGLSVSAERFRKMSLELLEDNWPRAELDKNRESVDRFLGWLEGVKNGDRYAVYWLPDQGLSLALNGKVLGSLDSAEGAAVVLSLWLGRAAVSESQRDELLAIWRGDKSR